MDPQIFRLWFHLLVCMTRMQWVWDTRESDCHIGHVPHLSCSSLRCRLLLSGVSAWWPHGNLQAKEDSIALPEISHPIKNLNFWYHMCQIHQSLAWVDSWTRGANVDIRTLDLHAADRRKDTCCPSILQNDEFTIAFKVTWRHVVFRSLSVIDDNNWHPMTFQVTFYWWFN